MAPSATASVGGAMRSTALHKMDQGEMVSRYVELRDSGEADGREGRALADAIIGSFYRMVCAVMWRRYYEIPAYVARMVDRDDLLAAGMSGLWKALDSYDQTRGVAFPKYAYGEIRWAMLAEVRRCDPLSQYARRRVNHTEKKKAELRQRLQREPSEHETAEEAGVSFEALRQQEVWFNRSITASLPDWYEEVLEELELEEAV